MKKCCIFETLSDIKELTISKKDDGLMSLSGIFGICGIKNNNNRIYEVNNYKEMIRSLKERIDRDGGIPGELEHPSSMNITLENISHKITDINIDDLTGTVTGTIELLNTPKGKIAQAIVEGGLPLYISSRATGSVDNSGVVRLECLQTYDLVGSPGFSQAELHLNENLIRESMLIDEKCDIVVLSDNAFYITESNNNNENMNKNESNITPDFQVQLDQLEQLKSDVENAKTTVKDIMNKLETLKTSTKDLNSNDPETELKDSENQVLKGNDTPVKDKNKEIEDETCDVTGKVKDLEYKVSKISEELSYMQDEIDNFTSAVSEGVENWYIKEIAPKTQEWINEEFSIPFKENIISNVQNWITEEFSKSIQDWFINEAAKNIQNWIIEEYSPTIQNWLNEEYIKNIENKITESLNESKKNSLSSIDSTLKLLENFEVSKPIYGNITEDINAPKYIAEMPESVRPNWNMASKQVRESISRKAKLYNFNYPNAINEFWEGIDFNSLSNSQINENSKPQKSKLEFSEQIREELLKGRFSRK